MMKRITLFLLLLFLVLTVSCTKIDNPHITFAENGVLAARQSTEQAGEITVPTPAGMHAPYCVGWAATVNGATVFLPVGATYAYEAQTNVTFSPVYLHLTTKTEATVDVAATSLRFTTTFAQNEWQTLSTLAKAVSCGTLVLPAADAALLSTAPTHAALTAAEKSAADLAADVINTDDGYFSATLQNIATSDLFTKYTALGYAEITYTNGDTRYLYASYENAQAPSASLILSAPPKSTLALITAPPVLQPMTGAMQFMTSLDAAMWEACTSDLITLTCGTLFATGDDLAKTNGVLTHAALLAAGCTPVEALSYQWQSEQDGKLFFEGVLSGLASVSTLLPHTAIGFVKITYPDNSYDYIYAAYEGTHTALSLRDLAVAAQNDLYDEQTDTHPHAAGDKFSPYTAEEQEAIRHLTKISLTFIYDKNAPAKKQIAPEYLTYFNVYTVEFADAKWSDATQEIWDALGDIHLWGGAALVITMDGTPITEEIIGTLTLQNGSITAAITKYECHNGKLILPYSNYIPIPKS